MAEKSTCHGRDKHSTRLPLVTRIHMLSRRKFVKNASGGYAAPDGVRQKIVAPGLSNIAGWRLPPIAVTRHGARRTDWLSVSQAGTDSSY